MSDLQLLSPITIGGQELKNRVILAPLTRARCTPSKEKHDIKATLPNDLMKEYYTQRATAGLILTEATAVSDEGFGWPCAPKISTEKHAEAWKPVVDSVHAAGGKIYLQLWHMGRAAHSSHHPTTNRVVSASAIPIPSTVKSVDYEDVPGEVPHAMTVEEIKQTVADYANAAKMCKKAGFDGVEIHGANGYLVDQFLQTCSNVRTDQYGGSIENRARFLMEIIDAIIASGAYPANRIALRLSPNGAFGGMGSKDNVETFTTVCKMLNKYGLAFLDIMDGLGFGFHNLCKPVTVMDIKKVFDGPIFCNVGLTRDVAEGMIRSGTCDAAIFGRLYISNPDLPERFANDWPVEAMAPYETWWRHSAEKGYTNWPTYQQKQEKKKLMMLIASGAIAVSAIASMKLIKAR